MAKTDKMVEMAKQKSVNREADVLKVIKSLIKSGEKVSVYSVANISNASKSFIYGNKKIMAAIDKERNKIQKTEMTAKSKESIISALKNKIKTLESEKQTLIAENSETYKTKYEKLLIENKELKEQLKVSYKY